MAAGASFELPPEHEERDVYAIDGELTVAGESEFIPLPER